jgi:hypothetical protein
MLKSRHFSSQNAWLIELSCCNSDDVQAFSHLMRDPKIALGWYNYWRQPAGMCVNNIHSVFIYLIFTIYTFVVATEQRREIEYIFFSCHKLFLRLSSVFCMIFVCVCVWKGVALLYTCMVRTQSESAAECMDI